MHEPTAPRVSGETMEERVQEFPILRQDRPDNDTFASSQTYHVDQFGRITLDLVSHTSIALRPKNETRGRAVGEQVSFAVGEPFFWLGERLSIVRIEHVSGNAGVIHYNLRRSGLSIGVRSHCGALKSNIE
jgi:hypothetical protein